MTSEQITAIVPVAVEQDFERFTSAKQVVSTAALKGMHASYKSRLNPACL